MVTDMQLNWFSIALLGPLTLNPALTNGLQCLHLALFDLLDCVGCCNCH